MNSFFRFLLKNKLYTAINLFGLAISLMFVVLIADYTLRQLTSDSFQEKKDRTYVLANKDGLASYYPDGLAIADAFPEVEAYCNISSENQVVSLPESEISNKSMCLYADSSFFDVFSYKILRGDRQTALDSREKCVITQSLATSLFGDSDPIGKIICIKDDTHQYTISALIPDFDRTLITSDTKLIVRMEERSTIDGVNINEIISIAGGSAIKLFLIEKENSDLSSKTEELKDFLVKNSMPYKYVILSDPFLIPMKDVLFSPNNNRSDLDGMGLTRGNLKMIKLLFSICLAILLFAFINYINLTVAQTGMRAKEMASRKLLGAYNNEITFRFVFESLAMTFVASIIGVALAIVMEPKASSLFGGVISIINDMNLVTVSVFILLVALLGIISGLIPAYTISRYKPVDIVKGSLRYHSKMVAGRIFIIFQNIITIVLISASITIYCQMKHMIAAPMGFNQDNIAEIHYSEIKAKEWDTVDSDKLLVVKSELEQLSFIDKVGLSDGCVTGSRYSWSRFSNEEGKSYTYSPIYCDAEYVDIFGLEMTTNNNPAGEAYYPDERFMDLFGLPYDAQSMNPFHSDIPLIVGGVMKNIHVGTIDSNNPPLLMHIVDFKSVKTVEEFEKEYYPMAITVKFKENTDLKAAFKEINGIFEKVTDDTPRITMVKDVISSHYEKERNMSRIVLMFTIIAIIISTLGLLAMSTYFTRQRRVEVGVRRVFGSTIKQILSRLLWTFIRPMIISFIIAFPVAWIIMEKWLTGYSYRMDLSPWIFIAAGVFSFLIATLTVFWQALRTACLNPTESVKAL